MKKYKVKSFSYLLGIKGFSDKLLKDHFKLYEGYVDNVNKLMHLMKKLEKESKMETPKYTEIKRRFSWEWNGMRLHEYYFWNISKKKESLNINSDFYKQIKRDFGSFINWETDFKNMGKMRGVGWIILYYAKVDSKFFNIWVNEHESGHLAGAEPILVMDVFEHAYLQDYGLKRVDYIESFFNRISWSDVVDRFDNCIDI